MTPLTTATPDAAGTRYRRQRIRALASLLACPVDEALDVVERLIIETRHSNGSLPFSTIDGLEARLGSRWPPGELLRALHVVGLVAADDGDVLRTNLD